MGYAAEKKVVEGKVKRIKYVFLAVAIALIAGLCVFASYYPPESWKYYFGLPDVSARKKGEMRVHFLDVGQGDCTLVEFPDGQTMLVDGGNGSGENNKRIMRYLNALEIDVLDYLVLSHSDSDHVGALDEVLKYKTVRKVLYNTGVSPTVNKEYASFYDALSKSDAKKQRVERYTEIVPKHSAYPFTCVFLSPVPEESGVEAFVEKSAVLWLDYGGVSLLLTGDAGFDTEKDIMTGDYMGYFSPFGAKIASTEILKVAHHGSGYSTSEEFLRYLNAETAVISCGKDNAYGHPNKEVLSLLELCGVATYRTDQSGHLLVTIKDGTYSVKTKKI